MSYSASKIECLRFAGRTGGEGIGCCAIDMFQGFVNRPSAPGAVQLMHGDTGTPLFHTNGGAAWLGPTNRDIFEGYLRVGTFDTQPMPNRAFLVALTDEQLNTDEGLEWLAILKAEGFEHVRTIDNSVYSGQAVGEPGERVLVESGCPCCPDYYDDGSEAPHPVHIFGLFRNIGMARIPDPFDPPQAWKDLPEPTKTPLELWLERGDPIKTEAEATGKAEIEVPAAPVAKPW